MKKIICLFCLFVSLYVNAQYNPVNFTVSNKSYGLAQAATTDARSWYYDGTNFVMRDYNGTSEVLSYLNLSIYRSGHFPIYVHSGGTLNSGVWTGGITLVYFFKNGTADGNLVRWYTDSTIVTPKVDTMYRKNDSIIGFTINNGPEQTILIRGTAAGGINALTLTAPSILFGTPITFTNTGGSWAGSLILTNQNANSVFAGPSTGGPGLPSWRQIVLADLPSGIPNANLQNSSINLGLGTSGTDINWGASPISLGGTATLNIPSSSAVARGLLTAGSFTQFTNKVDSTSQSNDSVYDWHNGAKIFRYMRTGGGGGGVSTVGFTAANGFTGAFANPTTTPNLTLGTSITGLLFGNGTAISNATVSSPLTYSTGTLGIQVANTSQNGYLSSTDWNTFNGKQASLSNSGSGYRFFVPGSSMRSLVCAGCTLDSTTNAGSLTLIVTAGGSGTVTSVAASVPSTLLTIGGSPITTSGTLAIGLATASANLAFGNFTGSTATPTFGKLPLAAMATGTANSLIGYDGSGNPSGVAVGTGLALSGNTLIAVGGGGALFAKGLNSILGGDTVATYTINIMDFGAIPDCNGTSGNGTDNTAAIRAAIAAANAVGASIFIPPVPKGSPVGWSGFRFTDSLLFAGKNIELYGAGMGQFIYYQLSATPSIPASMLYFDHPTNNAVVIQQTVSNVYPVMRLHDFTLKNIWGTRTAVTSSGIVIRDNNQESIVENMSIERFYTNVNQISANLITYQHVNSLFPIQYGFIVGNNAANDFGGHHFNHVNVVADTFATTTAIGIYVKNPAAFEMTHCSISGLVAKPLGQFIIGVYADFSDGPTSDIRIANCYFEGIQHNTINIHNTSGQTSGNVQISDNELYMYTSATGFPNVQIVGCYNVQLHGLILGGNVGSLFALELDSINNLSITGPMNMVNYGKLANINHSTINQNDFYGATLNHGAVTDSSTHRVIGTTTLDGPTAMNAKVDILPGISSTTGYQHRMSDWYSQSVAFNNDIFAADANYNSGWTRPTTGYPSGINAYIGQFGIFANNTGTGAFTPIFPFKADYSNGGSVHLGGNANMGGGGLYSGSSMTIDGGKIRIVPGVLPTGTSGTDSFFVWHPADSTMRLVAPLGGGVAGSNTQIQFNNSGAFGASSSFTFNTTGNQLTLDPGAYTLTDYQMRLGDMNFQMAAANNFFLFDNAKYASGWTRVATGYTEGFNYFNGQIGFSANPSGSAGALTPQFIMKVDDLGFVAMGGKTVDMAHGSYSGATMLVSPDSIMITKPGIGNSTMPSLVWNVTSHRIDTMTITGGGGGGVTTVGVFSGSSIANGASISTSTITFGPADGTNPGMVTTGAQTLAGAKTFTGQATFPAATTGAASLLITTSAGVNPTSPTSGQFWWNGTNLNFRTGSTTVDLLAGGYTPTLTYTQLATSNTLALTGATTQTFLTATQSLAGLLDTARAKYIDSARNRLILFNLNVANGLSAPTPDSIKLGGTLNQRTTIDGGSGNNDLNLGNGLGNYLGGFGISATNMSINLRNAGNVSFVGNGIKYSGGTPGNVNLDVTATNGMIFTLATITANRTITLPSATGAYGQMYEFVNYNTANFTWTFVNAVSDLNGNAYTTIPSGSHVRVFSDNINWYVINITNANNSAGSFSQVGTATTTFTVSIGKTQSNATYKVNVTPTAALSAALFYVTNKTTTTFDVVYLAGLTGTVTFDWTVTP